MWNTFNQVPMRIKGEISLFLGKMYQRMKNLAIWCQNFSVFFSPEHQIPIQKSIKPWKNNKILIKILYLFICVIDNNKIILKDLHTVLGQITHIDLSRNNISSLHPFKKLYSLQVHTLYWLTSLTNFYVLVDFFKDGVIDRLRLPLLDQLIRWH